MSAATKLESGPQAGRLVSVSEAQEQIAAGVTVLDVRTPGEFSGSHISGAINLPVDQLNGPVLETVAAQASWPMLVICQSSVRAQQAANRLEEAGFGDTTVLANGMNAWQAAGAPTEQVPADDRWAMERQVRLVAGSIVLTSVLASALVPKAKWLAAGIGGGLTFAAVSNTCMMGDLLGKLPYNRTPEADVTRAVSQLTR